MAREPEILIEQATTAWRERDARGGIRSHAAWHDLDAAGRDELYRATRRMRRLEAAFDPENRSTTVRAVLARIRGSP